MNALNIVSSPVVTKEKVVKEVDLDVEQEKDYVPDANEGRDEVSEALNIQLPESNPNVQPMVKQDNTEDIYNKLGDKTKSNNVIIKSWYELKSAKKAITPQGIVSTRIPNTNEHFGNPYSHDPAGTVVW